MASDKEYQIKLRTGRASDREELVGMQDCYNRAVSKEDFFERVKKCGLKIYSRGGKISGVVYGNRKFRFKRLGLTPEILEELDVIMKRNNELSKVRGRQKFNKIIIEK